MRRFLLCLFLCLSFGLAAQTVPMGYLLSLPVETIGQIDTAQRAGKVFLHMPYGSAQILNPEAAALLKGKVVSRVELVYTTFRRSETFAQPSLNRNRLESLKTLLPELFDEPATDWRVFAQTGAKSEQEGEHFFHGFVLYFRSDDDPVAAKTEALSFMKAVLGGMLPPCGFERDSAIKDTAVIAGAPGAVGEGRGGLPVPDVLPEYFEGERELFRMLEFMVQCPPGMTAMTVSVSFVVDETGKLGELKIVETGSNMEAARQVYAAIKSLNKWKPGYKNGLPCKSQVRLKATFTARCSPRFSLTFGESWGKRARTRLGAGAVSGMIARMGYNPDILCDSTVMSIFNRNPTWDKMLVVCDLTGSMIPYVGQVFTWYKLMYTQRPAGIKHVLFFNDGDQKLDFEKVPGKVGGIYGGPATEYDDMVDLAEQTLEGGFGGDRPENNVEALIAGIAACPDCTEVVMVADNYATPRDLVLLEKVKRPVRIILCGTKGGLNTRYLDLARATGGSVHTIEKDLDHLMDLGEGEILEEDGKQYIIRDGKFERVWGN